MGRTAGGGERLRVNEGARKPAGKTEIDFYSKQTTISMLSGLTSNCWHHRLFARRLPDARGGWKERETTVPKKWELFRPIADGSWWTKSPASGGGDSGGGGPALSPGAPSGGWGGERLWLVLERGGAFLFPGVPLSRLLFSAGLPSTIYTGVLSRGRLQEEPKRRQLNPAKYLGKRKALFVRK